MTSINGIKVQDDNIETILARYASENNTLRKYLYLEEKFEKDKDNIIINFLKIIRESGNTTYTDFYKQNEKIISSKVKNEELDLKNDIIKFWVAYNNIFNNIFPENFLQDISDLIFEDIKDVHGQEIQILLSSEDIQKFYTDKEDEIGELQKQINENKKMYEKRAQSNIDFASIPSKTFSDIDIQSVSMTFVLKVSELSLSELFNNIILNNDIPFVYYKNFFKIIKSFKVDESWYQESKVDEIILYVKDKISEESFTKVTIDEKFKVSFDLITKKGYLTSEKFIENIVKVLNISKNSIQDVTEEKISSFFTYENSKINSYIFADLVMNDNFFSSFMFIDESTKTTKKQTSSGERWIYIHFNDATTGYLTAGITQRVPDEEYSQPYLKINCKGKDRNKVENFQTIFGKLISLYENLKDDIIKQYREFIENFTDEQQYERKISRKTMIKVKTAEDVKDPNEIVGFSRQCQTHKNLVKIDENEYKQSREGDAIQFPRSEGIGDVKYPSDGKNISYYKCIDGTFPGIQNNTTGNFQEYFPYLPCCFKKQQTERTIFKHYYKGLALKAKGQQQELIKTEKILDYDNFGELSETLNNLFKITDPDSEYAYHRFGMDRSTGSFISCILTGILDTEYTKAPDKNSTVEKLFELRKTKIDKLRKEFSLKDILPLCKQCAYDIPDGHLKNIIQNNDIYFDPRMFVQLIEEYFDLNVIVFNRDGIVKPYYSQKYYHNFKTNKHYIFIYENWGSERDRAKYPQCELIIRWNKPKKETLYTFTEDEYVCQNIKNIFSNLIQSYILSSENRTIYYNEKYFQDKFMIIKSQNIDSYGKTRQINVEYENNNITILTSPIQPLKTVIKEDFIYKTSEDIAIKIFKELEMKVISQTNKKIKASNGSDVFTIFLGEDILEKKSSTLSLYNQNKKTARYLSSYILWNFSNYIEENKIDSVDDDVVNDFSNDMIVIKEDYKYENILKTFSKKSPVFDVEGKLILTSEEMRKRLLYLLRLKLNQNYRQVLSYNQNQVIPDYYIDLTDFDVHENQTILQGSDCIYKWNLSLDNKVYIYDMVNTELKQPYFFKNKNIDDKIYLAQNTEDIDSAIKIALIWDKEGYNIGYNVESDISSDYSFILYSYRNRNDIVKYEIQGKNKSSKSIQIIGYKINENDRFTVLLEN